MLNVGSVVSNSDANALWLLGERALRVAFVLATNVLIARHLGATDYGLLCFALSVVSFFTIITHLGLQDVLVKYIVSNPQTSNSVLGTGAALIFITGCVCFVVNLGISLNLTTPDGPLLVSIVGITILLMSSVVFESYFQACVAGKFIALSKGAALLASLAVKFTLVQVGASTLAFAIAVVFDATIILLALYLAYQFSGKKVREWTIKKNIATQLLKDSWPLLLSGVFVTIYMKTDQLMLQYYLGSEAVGHYSVAIQLSQAWYFIPMLISSAYFPAIIKNHANDPGFDNQLRRLYRMLCLIGIAAATLIMFFCDEIILTLFGAEYAPAITILKIHIWAGIFVGLGTLSGKWLITKSLNKHTFYRTGCGAALNVVLNFWLIPSNGMQGAAIATLLAHVFAAYVYDVIHHDTRPAFIMKTKALLYPIPSGTAKFVD